MKSGSSAPANTTERAGSIVTFTAPPTFRHGVYIADRLIQIAEASGLARYEEQRGKDLGAEREHLLAGSMGSQHETYPFARTTARDGLAHDELAAIQPRLSGLALFLRRGMWGWAQALISAMEVAMA